MLQYLLYCRYYCCCLLLLLFGIWNWYYCYYCVLLKVLVMTDDVCVCGIHYCDWLVLIGGDLLTNLLLLLIGYCVLIMIVDCYWYIYLQRPLMMITVLIVDWLPDCWIVDCWLLTLLIDIVVIGDDSIVDCSIRCYCVCWICCWLLLYCCCSLLLLLTTRCYCCYCWPVLYCCYWPVFGDLLFLLLLMPILILRAC